VRLLAQSDSGALPCDFQCWGQVHAWFVDSLYQNEQATGTVAWHQRLAIAVRTAGNWMVFRSLASKEASMSAPTEILERMLTVRLHLMLRTNTKREPVLYRPALIV